MCKKKMGVSHIGLIDLMMNFKSETMREWLENLLLKIISCIYDPILMSSRREMIIKKIQKKKLLF